MRQFVQLVIAFGFVLGASGSVVIRDRTVDEFRKYAAGKLSGLTDARLDEIVKRVDADSDGTVTDEEFAKHVRIFRDVMNGPEPWRTNLAKARAAAKETGKPLLVYFRAEWCAPCKQFEQKLLPDDEVQNSLAGFVLVRIDIDEDKDTAEAYDVTAIPTFVLEGSDAKEVDRQAGASKKSLFELLSKRPEPSKQTRAGVNRPLRLRVLSYNIHHGEGVDKRLDLDRIAAVIKSAKPDIVALQEVDKKCKRSGDIDQPAELARLTKMNVVFEKNINLGTGEYGNALMTRFPIDSKVNHKLPSFENGEQRGLLDVMLKVPGGSLRFLATHFDHRKPSDERHASAKAVNKLLALKPDQPTLLAGDLNAGPNSDTVKSLLKQWTQANKKPSPTVPVSAPARQIDYVLAAPKPRWKTIETRVLDEAVASDHRAILAVLELTPSSIDKPTSKPKPAKTKSKTKTAR